MGRAAASEREARAARLRVFVAVFPPPALQGAAAATIELLRRLGDGVSWVKTENLHYTLRFLGEVGEDGARRIAEAAREAAKATPRFEAALGALGAFPSPQRARVLWVGLESGAEELQTLAQRLDRALERRGFGAPDKPFSAHLTIGRVRVPGVDWTAALASQAVNAEARRFAVDQLLVVQSRLSPKGSVYQVLEVAPLAE